MRRRLSTACRKGHVWTPENTFIHTDGKRRCRACQRERDARRNRSTRTPEERLEIRRRVAAAHAEQRRRDREALLAEVEFQLEAGVSEKLLPSRLGYDKPTSLARRLRRAERPDLAVLFERAA